MLKVIGFDGKCDMKARKSILMGISFLAIGFITTGVNSSLLRLPCKRLAHFSTSRLHSALQGSVIHISTVSELIECQEKCLLNDQCKSINYQQDGDQFCELNSLGSQSDIDEILLVDRKGWHFMSADSKNNINGDICGQIIHERRDITCTDTCECPGYVYKLCKSQLDGQQCMLNKYPKDCDIIRGKGETSNGLYHIAAGSSLDTLQVYCDLDTENYGWIVIQRRINGETNFDRNWNDYKNGFGILTESFWLGLEWLSKFSVHYGAAILRIELKFAFQPSTTYFAEYSDFLVANESTNYRLTLAGYDTRSTLQNSMNSDIDVQRHNGRMFSTKDKDNDPVAGKHCAVDGKGGWWYSSCYYVHINGWFSPSSGVDCYDPLSQKYIRWMHSFSCIVYTEMKIRYRRS